jgi:hypothetical protein
VAWELYKHRKEIKNPVAPDNDDDNVDEEEDIKPIEKVMTFRSITQNITKHITKNITDNAYMDKSSDDRRVKYEESKTEITIDDLTKVKGKEHKVKEDE